MLKLHLVQAEQGDCLILEHGEAARPCYLLIDGGPEGVYSQHLRAELEAIEAAGGKLELVVLSHVDDDHVAGLIEFLEDVRDRRKREGKGPVEIEAIWHNSFSRTLGRDVEEMFLHPPEELAGKSVRSREVNRSIEQGQDLVALATELKIPVNPGFGPLDLVLFGGVQPPPFGDLTLQILGPSLKNLANLRTKWLEWLQKRQRAIDVHDLAAAVAADRSVPNLSSIMFLAKSGRKPHEKTILCTGDGRGDQLVQALRKAKLLDAQGRFHVDILKMPHHGSARNVKAAFFETVTADRYVISANGRDGNPDPKTLFWILEAARKQGRAFEIIATNDPPDAQEFRRIFPPEEHNYRWTTMTGVIEI